MSDQLIREGLTFDDVLLSPGASDVLPGDVDLRCQLTREISLDIPLLSAAMDTITEHETAICLAQNGGIGMLHRNMPVSNQAAEVDKVKRSESGMIVDPITMRPEQPVFEALDVMDRYRISGVPVTRDGKAVGILTNRDLRFVRDTDQEISRVMTRENLVTVPPGTTIDRAKELLHKYRIEKLLVVDDHGMLCGLITSRISRRANAFPMRRRTNSAGSCAAPPSAWAKTGWSEHRPWWMPESMWWSWIPRTVTRRVYFERSRTCTEHSLSCR